MFHAAILLLLLACTADKGDEPDTGPGDDACAQPTTWYADLDADGFGNSDAPVLACDPPAGTSAVGGDCDDTSAATNPGAGETWYDGIDEDCAGDSDFDQDGDAHDDPSGGGDDCDDTDSAVNPEADDVPCNGVDDNCGGDGDEEAIVLQGGRRWLTASTYEAGWNELGHDDTAWNAAVAPAPNDCGWTFIPDNLGRGYETWEHAGTPTMWSDDGATHIYLRLSFYLPDGAVVTQAMLTSIVDDEHTVYLNGVEVAFDDEPDGVPIIESDLTEALVSGENILAVDAEDLGGCAWALIDASVSCER